MSLLRDRLLIASPGSISIGSGGRSAFQRICAPALRAHLPLANLSLGWKGSNCPTGRFLFEAVQSWYSWKRSRSNGGGAGRSAGGGKLGGGGKTGGPVTLEELLVCRRRCHMEGAVGSEIRLCG